MARRAVLALTGACLVALAGGCSDTSSPVPDRPPDVRGVVADGPDGPVLAEPSDAYYEGMALLRGDPVVLRADDGATVAPAELRDGAPVEVWTEGPCAESFPVQCDIVALRVEQ